MRALSKSKLMTFRQCPKRLWLEIHRPSLREDSAATQASFDTGHQVGEIAQRLYDPKNAGVLIDAQRDGFKTAFAQSEAALQRSQPIFEAGFSAGGALAFADVMLPAGTRRARTWRMVEVKSSTSVKDYHRDDVAIQAFVARSAGVPLKAISLAHIDSSWVYPGGEDYQGLLTEHDLTEEAFARDDEVKGWIADAQVVAGLTVEPKQRTGRQCTEPYECGFLSYCESQEPQAEYPVHWLPRIGSKGLRALIEEDGVADLREVPDDLLNDRQRRVKAHTLSGRTFFDATGAAADLAPHRLPAYFLDFETIQFAVPIWKGTRPYQQIPFQFSVHRLSRTGKLEHRSFLDLSGGDPSRSFAETLIAHCGQSGPVFVYNAGFETARIRELADRFPHLKASLLAINERVADLLPIAQERYYHPSQQGSWSIKKVLPAVAPDLRYDALDGVQDGGMAMSAYQEAIHASTTRARKDQIEQQLFDYCSLDTFAMVRLWQFFAGRNDLKL
ncbi:DUF2779 domain-containing protein [Ralstonia insidiosa]|uniref:DUF2779 domain-containing protein n=2 Tax=Ralstonia insidiosa TaxID=190721 RepID=A0A848NX09_9RALS|nr:DUF2779 domain-containing protein [Ralstonia insidiosa]